MSSINTKQIPMVCLWLAVMWLAVMWLAVMWLAVFERVVVLLVLCS
jgi:hypothetical protein